MKVDRRWCRHITVGHSQITAEMDSTDWETRKGFKHTSGWNNVRHALARWHSFEPLYIKAPNQHEFKSPLEHEETRLLAARSANRSQLLMIGIAGTTTIALLFASTLTSDDKAITALTASAVLMALFIFDYFHVIRSEAKLESRSIAVNFMSQQARVPLFVATSFMLLIFLSQLAIANDREPDEIFLNYGAVYSSIGEGEVWRIFLGPYLHSSVVHWGANLALALFAVPLAWKLSKTGAVFTFLICNCVGAATAYLAVVAFGTTGDVYVGVSAGIYGLLGYSGMSIWLAIKPQLERSFGLTIIIFSATFVFITWILYPQAANLSHLTGFLGGVVLAFVLTRPQRIFDHHHIN